MDIEIITRCTRPQFLIQVKASILAAHNNTLVPYQLTWKIIFDTSSVSKIDSSILASVNDTPFYTMCYFWEGTIGDYGHSLLNKAIDTVPSDSWIYILDDDNEIDSEFLSRCLSLTRTPSLNHVEGIIVSQKVDKKDFTGLDVREAKIENVKVGGIDMAQFILKKTLVIDTKFRPMTYVADGYFIEEIYNSEPGKFYFDKDVLCNYNSLQVKSKSYMLPRILLLGSEDDEIKSFKVTDFESDDLNVILTNDDNVVEKIIEHDPDAIVSISNSFTDFPKLCAQSSDVKLRWIHYQNTDYIGEAAYRCGMNYIMSSREQEMVSIFTPVYNIGQKLFRTYESVKKQTYSNWEWVIVNDSTDNVTLGIAESIAKNDPRVKVFDFAKKSKGIIGESKYRACSMSAGKYLFELDHDDVILPHAINSMIEAFNKHSDAGFVYSDCAEINEKYESLTYGESFAFGYGSYREESHLGIVFKIADTPNINPLTIRHIVGVPNHFRAWRRDVYFAVGGHNRKLSIADDYELLIRTFLVTKFVKVQKGCYLQFHHTSNSQNSTRADIQRRVRTISAYYNDKIKARFAELGIEDWAYTIDGGCRALPRKNEEEKYVNYII